jgi:hypothetical protein
MFAALALAVLTFAAGAAAQSTEERHPQHDMVASSHGREVQASLGSHCTVGDGATLCADSAYPLPAEKRLPAHGGGRIVLQFKTEPRELDPQLRDRRSRSVYELRARGTGKRRTIRLPRRLPKGTDRLGVFAGYARGDADFEVDLKRHRHG